MDKNNWLTVGVITVIWFIGALGFYSQTNDLKTLFLAINALGVILATYINLVSSFQKIRFDRIQNSFEFVSRWDGQLLKEARDFTRNLLDGRGKLSQDVIYERVNDDPNLRRSVVMLFNFWQDMYLSIANGRVVEPILKRAFSHIYVHVYDTFKCWIEKRIKVVDEAGYKDLESLKRMWTI